MKTNMTRLRGWAPKGERLVDKVPHGRWKTATFLAALRNDRIDAPGLFDGPLNGERFRAYVEPFLKADPQAGRRRHPRQSRARSIDRFYCAYNWVYLVCSGGACGRNARVPPSSSSGSERWITIVEFELGSQNLTIPPIGKAEESGILSLASRSPTLYFCTFNSITWSASPALAWQIDPIILVNTKIEIMYKRHIEQFLTHGLCELEFRNDQPPLPLAKKLTHRRTGR